MKEPNIVICNADAVYAKALVQAFQRKKEFEANYIILTDYNKLVTYIKEDTAVVYIVEAEAYENTVLPYVKDKKEEEKEKLLGRMFVLTESISIEYELSQTMFKYQPVQAILEPIHEWLSEHERDLFVPYNNSKVIGVLAYGGANMASVFGHMIAKLYAETKQVLFVNMEMFPHQYGNANTQYNLSDYIYASSTGSDTTGQIIAGMCYDHGALHCVTPVQCFEDLYELRDNDMSNFFKQLKEQSGCEVIVIVFDFARPFILEALSGCDTIVTLEGQDIVSNAKREQMQQMFALEQKEWLLDRMKYCKISSEYLLANVSQEGEVSAQARSMFQEFMMELVS